MTIFLYCHLSSIVKIFVLKRIYLVVVVVFKISRYRKKNSKIINWYITYNIVFHKIAVKLQQSTISKVYIYIMDYICKYFKWIDKFIILEYNNLLSINSKPWGIGKLIVINI